jgi:hypothetical protein
VSDVAKIDKLLDETLVNLGAMVLRLADPAVTRTADEHRALAKSVRQYARCAERSVDPRVHQLREELEKTVEPRPRLVWSQ